MSLPFPPCKCDGLTSFNAGLLNITTLQEVLSSQTLTYTFPFSSFSFPTDISCIILTEEGLLAKETLQVMMHLVLFITSYSLIAMGCFQSVAIKL